MRSIPEEGLLPHQKKSTRKPPMRRPLPGHPRLSEHQLALRKISSRLNSLAKHDLPDQGIVDLLEDTRTQVLSLHLLRKQLGRSSTKKRKPRRQS